jgi:hypothetical protein
MRRTMVLSAALTLGLVGGCSSDTAETTTTTAGTTTTTVATTTTAPATTTTTTVATTTTTEPPAPVSIDPRQYTDDTEWDEYYGITEDAGTEDLLAAGFTHHHAWGSEVGQMAYAFSLDRLPVTGASLTARLSAEVGEFGSDPTDVSDVTLVVNGTEVGTITVQYDDGSGADYTWDIPIELLVEGENTVAFRVEADAEHTLGLCVYGTSVDPAYEDAAIVISFT